MALTTRNNRAGAINVGLGFGRIFPNPDVGAEGAADRQQTALCYPGILAAAFSIATVFGDLTTLFHYYTEQLHDTHVVQEDTNVLVRDDRPNLISIVGHGADTNTDYARYLS